MNQRLRIPAWAMVLALSSLAHAVEHVTFRQDERTIQVAGEVVVEAVDGGVLLVDRAGALWAVPHDKMESRKKDDAPFEPYDADALAGQLLPELPRGFQVHKTAHYVICHNTSDAYARWCGSLFERLYLAFYTFWRERGTQLQDPRWPLAAVVFDRRNSYADYSRPELGEATSSIVGYYSLRTNRMTMYDLTGSDTINSSASRGTEEQIIRILSRPQAERTVATIIHEATHQLAFNGGLLTRYADIPLWVSEGIAIYFETPDLQSKRGWRNIGGINRVRFPEFRQYTLRRPADSLRKLLSNDDRFRRAETAGAAYAEAWALNYFLLRKHREAYVSYLKELSKKRPLIDDEPQERIKLFTNALQMDLAALDAEFLRYMAAVR
jgi:hypothetical protein